MAQAEPSSPAELSDPLPWPPEAGVAPPWWQRLHDRLMPDYNAAAAAFWWLLVVCGAVLLAACAARVAQLPAAGLAQLAAALVLALLAGLVPVRVPNSRHSFVAGEVFIFLALLLLGPLPAALVAAAEALAGAWRTSRRWTSRLVSPATAAIAMAVAGSALHGALALLAGAGWTGAAPLLAATLVAACAYFGLNAVLIAGIQHLKRGEPFLQLKPLFGVFRWVGLAYAGSAGIAALLFELSRQQGAAVLVVMLPLLGLLLVTLHFYFREQEARRTLHDASRSSAEREAVAAAREAAAAARHLRELQASERRFHSAFTHAAIGMALLDFDGRVLQANPAMCSLLGRREADLLQQPFQAHLHADDRPQLEGLLGLADRHRLPRDAEGFRRELRAVRPDGSTAWLALQCAHFVEGPGWAGDDAEPAPRPCLIVQAQDVTARRRAEAGLQQLAFHDPLTGLPNRRRFIECLAGAVARFRIDRARPWAVMFIDCDRFKLVNDSLGHNAGDELLRQMARRIQEKLRPGDIVARLGGDEFAILAEQVEHERDAVVLAERLMDALRRPFVVADVELIASASIGITFSALDYASAEDVLRDADTAMYKAKHGGRSRYAFFDASLHSAVSERLRLEGDLRQAIERGQLAVLYQPVVDLATGALQGFEALLRWQHPQSGLLEPGRFLPVAEESGQMVQLSDFVLHCACHQLRQWQLSDPAWAELTMAVNLSAHDLAHPALVARVSRALVEAGVQPRHLTLELTENIIGSQIDDARAALAELRRLGTRLAVDDFGTGHSSLGHLSKLPFDSLKIDRSFVGQLAAARRRDAGPHDGTAGDPATRGGRGAEEAGDDSDGGELVGAIVRLGAALHKAVVAEGIESAEQLQALRDLGCTLGQGFHLATPLTEQAAAQWLREHRAGGSAALH
jgi:diguanylate cyclase (GGDEF)-like protein/PAS domain S-box-containing protein